MLVTVLVFLATLSLLILVHELGHFFAARKFKIKVEEFGFGYPPRILAKKKDGVAYSLNWIPFGGFVSLLGENRDVDDPHSFSAQPWWVRSVVALAGIFNNFVLALVIYSFLFLIMGIPRMTDQVLVEMVHPDSPAQAAGIEAGDKILTVNDQRFGVATDFVDYVLAHKGEELTLKINRDGEALEFKVTGRTETTPEQGSIGVVATSVEIYRPPFWQAPFLAIYHGAGYTWQMIKLIAGGLGSLFRQLIFFGQIPEDIAGPVGILQITHQVTQFGLIAILEFIAMLSINLGLVNFLPIPGLDGGRFLFIMIRTVLRGQSTKKVELIANQLGFFLLVGLMFAITFNDLNRIIGWAGVGQWLGGLWPF